VEMRKSAVSGTRGRRDFSHCKEQGRDEGKGLLGSLAQRGSGKGLVVLIKRLLCRTKGEKGATQ